ncbi:fatty-acid-binding protein 1-like isoform X2 [Papaver somniferum]|uniref:fatty-acid-binding protein 1-like isoform X2 n=1 Tax=Papaver somniferum TaxID=3469 RepID=UPI000E6F679D|nr:fatty-acid-binding protein 1-like isoform X2 [Papaver somniferum]
MASTGSTSKETVAVQIEPKTGISFPVTLDDGMELVAVGLRKKSILGLGGIKVYGFGIFADNEKLKEVLRLKMGSKAPSKPTKEMYEAVLESDVGMMVRKLNGGQSDQKLTAKVFADASDNIKLTSGSIIEITRLPGYILQTKVKDEVVSKVESELLCKGYFHMYLGDEAFDVDAKERFGQSLLSLF